MGNIKWLLSIILIDLLQAPTDIPGSPSTAESPVMTEAPGSPQVKFVSINPNHFDLLPGSGFWTIQVYGSELSSMQYLRVTRYSSTNELFQLKDMFSVSELLVHYHYCIW